MLVAGLFFVLRRLERWLHQHIFKVGWLLTKNMRTTTIIYYLIFMPGVVVYEVTIWLVAGMLDVRADRAISWPETQAVAELRLNFVKLSKNAGTVKHAIISISPLILGIALIYLIANSILDVQSFITALQTGGTEALPAAFQRLTDTPDFFIWVYLLFTIGNTMMPDPKNLRAWRIVGIGSIIGIVLLYVVGIGESVMTNGLSQPIANSLNLLSLTFGVIIAINLFATALLGTVEAIYERITGDSATFQNGKLVAMRRADIVRQRKEAQEKAERAQKRERERKGDPLSLATAGTPSIYRLPFPIPGAPGKEAESATVMPPVRPAETTSIPAATNPPIITGTATPVKPDDDDLDDELLDDEEKP